MRLDKFLKVSRLIKRRTVAKDVSEQGRVLVNGREAKPSAAVKVGDELTVQFGQKLVTVKVERLAESTKKDEASSLYTLVKEEPIAKDNGLNCLEDGLLSIEGTVSSLQYLDPGSQSKNSKGLFGKMFR
ncbi:hypothetical protein G195_005629 [Phytophthora kernoviae 00238/432]|uniref:RNA-binding S4 domain-containing protein n=1 Tax=Phytophthora kernoviae 00238/432 TaxID=1284355 RepID=A0A8J4SCE5_9STRA|nr:hypothetical protein G195_005629 [Phytophthora kernoviae 00238/432]